MPYIKFFLVAAITAFLAAAEKGLIGRESIDDEDIELPHTRYVIMYPNLGHYWICDGTEDDAFNHPIPPGCFIQDRTIWALEFTGSGPKWTGPISRSNAPAPLTGIY